MNELGDEENDLENIAKTLARESDIHKDIVIRNIDKTHPIGKIDDKGLQCRIVKFTSDSFSKKVFKKHKKNKKKIIIEDQKKKKQPINVKIKLQPSLAKNRLRMLKYTKEKLDDVDEMKFVYADMHGNLKVVLNPSPLHCKSVFDFQTESDIGRLLSQLSGGDKDYKNLYDN